MNFVDTDSLKQFITAAYRLKEEELKNFVSCWQPFECRRKTILTAAGETELAVERALRQNKPAVEMFKPGWLGDYFTKLMKPNENGTVANKMKSPKDHRPPKFLDAFPVLNCFLEQQQYLPGLLELAKSKNIGSIRVPISISRFIKLKVGDTFRFLVAHQQRHFVQIKNTLAAVGGIRPGKYPASLPVM